MLVADLGLLIALFRAGAELLVDGALQFCLGLLGSEGHSASTHEAGALVGDLVELLLEVLFIDVLVSAGQGGLVDGLALKAVGRGVVGHLADVGGQLYR